MSESHPMKNVSQINHYYDIWRRLFYLFVYSQREY